MREVLALVFMVRHDRRSWVPATLWSMVAVASLAAAVWIALQPGHLQDLHEVRQWVVYYRDHTSNPYSYFDRQLDYPPIALLVLSPLGLIPEASLAAWFLPASILIAALAGWFLVRAIADRLYTEIATAQRVAIVALILSGSSVRGAIWLGQTVALAVLCGALALLWSRRRPLAAALALAVCSFKPHLAFGFGLAILLDDGLDVIVIATAIVVSASVIVAAAIDQSVLDVVAGYGHNLVSMYDGAGRIRGLLSVRWAVEDVVGHHGFAQLLYAAVAIASLIVIGAVARRAPDAAARAQAIAAAMLWPLLFLPSQLYNGLMAAPALWLLMWPESGLIRRESRRLLSVATFALFGVIDVPRVLRIASDALDDGHWLYKGSYYLSPLRILLVFAFIVSVALRRIRARDGALSA